MQEKLMQEKKALDASAGNRPGATDRLVGPWLAQQPVWLRYGLAATIVLVATGLRSLLNPLLGATAPLLPMVLVVVISAILAGRGPALLATALAPSALLVLLLLTGTNLTWVPWLAYISVFIAIGVAITALIHALQLAYQRQSAMLQEATASEQRAAANEQQLRLISDSVPVLIAFLDEGYRYRFVNRQYEEWFGLPASEILGRHASEVLGDAAYADLQPLMAQALRGAPVTFERMVPYARGDRKYVRGHYVPHTTLGGATCGFFVLVEDITDRRRIEQRLLDMQDSLSMALRAGRSGTFEWDIRTNVNVYSDELLELYGLRRGELTATHEAWLQAVAIEDRERIAESARNALKVGLNQIDFRIRRYDTGELRWIHARGKVFYDDAGEPLRMVGINVDVTEDKRAAEALSESERKLKLIHDNTSDGIALLKIASDGIQVDSVNLSLLRAIALAREEIEGRLVAQLLPEPHRRALISKCRQAIGSSVPVTFDYEAPLNSEGRCTQISLIPIASVTGCVTHLLACIKDVTAAKHIERLQQLEARRKDEFLAMLAHELRNPLTPITNIAHLLTKQECTTAQVQEFALILQRQAQQLTRMVDDLLDVSRITRGVIELHTEVVDLVEVLRDAHEAMMPALKSKDQSLEVQWMVAAVCVPGDRARLTQIFTNLISNAGKYSDRGAIIEVRVEREAVHIVVRVIDSGAGIDAHIVGRVFDLFVQADQSLDRRESGLGVGLTIVKRLVDLHGGTVEARSAGLGRGSEFVVRLPLSGAAVGSAASSSGSPADQTNSLGIRVLIVDDNEPIAYTFGRLLQIEGFETRVVHSGQAALKELESYEARIVLLDIGLPDIDGYMVAQLIRERYPDRPLRLVAVTGYGTASDRELALTSGFDAHLTKPVAPEQLIKLITSGLSPAATVDALSS